MADYTDYELALIHIEEADNGSYDDAWVSLANALRHLGEAAREIMAPPEQLYDIRRLIEQVQERRAVRMSA